MAEGQSLLLSANELRTLTKWPDSVILEFLSLQAGVTEINEIINIVINDTTTNITMINQNSANISSLRKVVGILQNQLAAFDSMPGKIANLKRDQQRAIDNVIEGAASSSGLIARLQAKITTQADQIAALTENISAPGYTLLSRLTRETDARLDLAQELYGS